MNELVKRDLTAGAAMLAVGGFFAGHSLAQLRLGGFAQMGPGMFPLMMGTLLALLGLAQLTGTWLRATAGRQEPREDGVEPPQWAALGITLVAMAGFAVTIRWLGMIPAIFVIVIISASASAHFRFLTALILATGLSLATWLIFVEVLGLPFHMLNWPS